MAVLIWLCWPHRDKYYIYLCWPHRDKYHIYLCWPHRDKYHIMSICDYKWCKVFCVIDFLLHFICNQKLCARVIYYFLTCLHCIHGGNVKYSCCGEFLAIFLYQFPPFSLKLVCLFADLLSTGHSQYTCFRFCDVRIVCVNDENNVPCWLTMPGMFVCHLLPVALLCTMHLWV